MAEAIANTVRFLDSEITHLRSKRMKLPVDNVELGEMQKVQARKRYVLEGGAGSIPGRITGCCRKRERGVHRRAAIPCAGGSGRPTSDIRPQEESQGEKARALPEERVWCPRA